MTVTSLAAELIPFIALPSILEKRLGRKPCHKTLKRWRRDGVCKGQIVLESTRVGRHYYTRLEWLDAFFEAQKQWYAGREDQARALKARIARKCELLRSHAGQKAHERAMERLKRFYPDLGLGVRG